MFSVAWKMRMIRGIFSNYEYWFQYRIFSALVRCWKIFMSNKGIIECMLEINHIGKLCIKMKIVITMLQKIKITVELVSSMIEFTETILEYVYVLPAKLAEIQTQINTKAFEETN
jgi:hypothetical protein